ncbi:MAG: MFS transporter [Clostridia bacterium]|nr:MFS transporter [Clostridia bacterium]
MFKKLQDTFRADSAYRQFFICLLATGLAAGLYKGIMDNYLSEIVGMGEFDRGVAEFFRELPGLMLVFILAVFYTFSAEKMYKMGALIMVAGYGLLTALPANRALVTMAICIFSMGEHIQLGMKNTLSLEYAKPGKSGVALGMQNSITEIGMLAGLAIIMIAFRFVGGMKAFKTFLLVTTIVSAGSAIISMKIHGNSRPNNEGSRFYFRKKFTKYYMLEVFYGARKQVFLTFGPYVLIRHYSAGASVMSLLFAVSAICCYFLAPLVGKIIDKLGYKVVMVSDTLILVIVCFFYGFSHRLFPQNVAFIVCCVNYVLDSIISLASMASSVYVKDISDNQEEVRATLSTGISVNHMITVLIALFGGWIWMTLGIETLFICSAVLGLCNSAYAASIKSKKKA